MTLAARLKQQHPSSHRDVEAVDRRTQRDMDVLIRSLQPLRRYASGLRANDQHHRLAQIRLGMRARTAAVRDNNLQAMMPRKRDGLRVVEPMTHRQAKGGSHRTTHRFVTERIRTTSNRQTTGSTCRFRRAYDGTQIARVTKSSRSHNQRYQFLAQQIPVLVMRPCQAHRDTLRCVQCTQARQHRVRTFQE